MQIPTMAAVGDTAIYAALFAIMLVGLSINVIRLRVGNRVSLGDGGNEALRRAIRAHSNFCEFVPLALILMLLLELNGTGSNVLHGLGIALLAGRIAHAYSIPADALNIRRFGMLMTFGVLLTGAVLLLMRVL